jgi:hypothetical protein
MARVPRCGGWEFAGCRRGAEVARCLWRGNFDDPGRCRLAPAAAAGRESLDQRTCRLNPRPWRRPSARVMEAAHAHGRGLPAQGRVRREGQRARPGRRLHGPRHEGQWLPLRGDAACAKGRTGPAVLDASSHGRVTGTVAMRSPTRKDEAKSTFDLSGCWARATSKGSDDRRGLGAQTPRIRRRLSIHRDFSARAAEGTARLRLAVLQFAPRPDPAHSRHSRRRLGASALVGARSGRRGALLRSCPPTSAWRPRSPPLLRSATHPTDLILHKVVDRRGARCCRWLRGRRRPGRAISGAARSAVFGSARAARFVN